MDNQQIVELFQALEKYEILIEKITGELKKLNDIQQDK